MAKNAAQNAAQTKFAEIGSSKSCKLKTNSRQQDGIQREVQMMTEPQQALEKIKRHRIWREEILGVLPMTTAADDFQGLIRVEKDTQHVHAQDRGWPANGACMMEVEDLSRRQVKLGELEQIVSENCMACEERVRSINRVMNTAKVNDV